MFIKAMKDTAHLTYSLLKDADRHKNNVCRKLMVNPIPQPQLLVAQYDIMIIHSRIKHKVYITQSYIFFINDW